MSRASDRAVIDTHQKQALRRRGHAGGAPLAGGDDFGGPWTGFAAAADLDQRADHGADHVVQEAIAGNFEGEESLLRPCPAFDKAS